MTKILVSDSYRLYELLEKKYGERFNADPFVALTGQDKNIN